MYPVIILSSIYAIHRYSYFHFYTSFLRKLTPSFPISMKGWVVKNIKWYKLLLWWNCCNTCGGELSRCAFDIETVNHPSIYTTTILSLCFGVSLYFIFLSLFSSYAKTKMKVGVKPRETRKKDKFATNEIKIGMGEKYLA